jgi:glycerol-3-phosphate dehydrogenase (NAD(P)+)
MRVTVLGGGSWGTTMASLLAPRHPTVLWARNPDVADAVDKERANPVYLPGFELPPSLRATSDLEEASGSADLLIVGVPTSGFRKVLEDAKPFLRPWIPVVSLSKGLERGSLLRMTEVIKEVLPGHPAAALTGPNIAKEILQGKAAAAVVATEDLDVAAAIQKVVTRGLFRVYVNHDVVGCEIGGALKNVVAIAAGIGEGLGVGDNTRAAVMSRGLGELARLGVAMGAQPMTFAGLAGVGDLIATCMSPHSRNRAVGEQLGKGRRLDDILAEMRMVAEGVNTAVLVLDLAARHNLDMPICTMIDRVVKGEIAPADAYYGLTPAGHEFEPG